MIAGLLFIVSAPLLWVTFGSGGSARLRVAASTQALAGLVLAVSASRWLIVLPFLQKQYDKPDASAMTRAALNVDYDTISYFLGITLGEHLFAILTGTWTVLVAVHLVRRHTTKRWLGWLGLVAGIGWLLGSVEQLDFGFAQYFVGFLAGGPVAWLIWTVFLARDLTRRPQPRTPNWKPSPTSTSPTGRTPSQAATAPLRHRQQTTVLPVPTGGKQRRGDGDTPHSPHRTARHGTAPDWWRRRMTDTDPQTEAMLAGAEIEKSASDGRPTDANDHDGGAVDVAPPAHPAESAPLTTDEQVQVQNSVINPETS